MVRFDIAVKEKCLRAPKYSLQPPADRKGRTKEVQDPYSELLMVAIRCHNKSHDSGDASHLFTEEEQGDVEELLLENIRSQ